MCITLRWPLIPSIWSSFIDWQLSLTSSVAGIVWRLVAPFDSQSALLPNVSIFRPYDSHCLASTRTVMNLFIWTNTYLSQIVHCMLRFFIHVDVFSMYLPACPLSMYHHMLWHLCIFEMEGAFLLSLTKTMPKTNTIEIAFKYLLLSIEKLD